MSLKKTLILGALLAALLLYIVQVDRPKQEQAELDTQLFPKLAASQIAEVAITRRTKEGVESFRLVNSAPSATQVESAAPASTVEEVSPDGWGIAGIPHAKVDRSNLSALIRSLRSTKLESEIPKEDIDQDKSPYGLKEPEVSFTIKLAGDKGSAGRETTLNLGKRSEYLGKRFLEVLPEEKLYMTADELFMSGSRARDDFRERLPFKQVVNDLAKMKVSWPNQSIEFEKGEFEKGEFEKGEGAVWKMTSPMTRPAGAKQVQELESELAGLRVADFVDLAGEQKPAKSPTDVGLDHPDVTFQLTERPAGKPEVVRTISMKAATEAVQPGAVQPGAGQPSTWVREEGQPVMYRLVMDVPAKLKRDPDYYRERRLFQLELDKLREVVIEAEGRKTIRLVREEGSEWKVNDKPGDTIFISEVLRNISQLEAAGFPKDNRNFGFDKPRVTVKAVLASEDGKDRQERTLVIGGEADKELLTFNEAAPGAKDSAKAFFAGADDKSDPFVVSLQQVMKITPAEETLLKKADEDVEVEKVPIPESHAVE